MSDVSELRAFEEEVIKGTEGGESSGESQWSDSEQVRREPIVAKTQPAEFYDDRSVKIGEVSIPGLGRKLRWDRVVPRIGIVECFRVVKIVES